MANKARECVQEARAGHDDITWFKPIVAAYFARYTREGIDEYREILEAD